MMHERNIEADKSWFMRSLSELRWYAVATEFGGEFSAAHEIGRMLVACGLGAEGAEVYCPRYKVTVTTAARKRRVKTFPLIRGYVFVRGIMTFPLEIALKDVDRVDHIISSHFTDRPLPFRDSVIREIRMIEADENNEKPFSAGDWIKVVDGLMDGQEATVLRLDGSNRLELDVNGSSVRISIRRTAVERPDGVSK